MAAAWKLPLDTLVKKLLFQVDLPPVPLQASPGVVQGYGWVSGHGVGRPGPKDRGPRRRYAGAIVGKCLGKAESSRKMQMAGSTGMHLWEALKRAGLSEADDIYVTNLLKTQPLLKSPWKKAWEKPQWPFLMLELMLIQPDYVLLLGNEVIKAFLGNSATLKDLEGRWMDYKLDMRQDADEPEVIGENVKILKCLPCLNPAALEYEQKMEDKARLHDGVRQFLLAVRGEQSLEPPKLPDYPVVSDIHTLNGFMEQMADDAELKLVGVDAEWQGEHPQNRGSFLRCLQLGWRRGNAIVVSLTDKHGIPSFVGSNGIASIDARTEAFELIRRWFERARLRVAGFFYQADNEWLKFFGLDLMQFFEAASCPEKMRTEGGFGLDLAMNSVDELSRIDLDSARWRYTSIPSYKHVLHDYRKQIITAAKKLDEELGDYLEEGFGWLPDEILYPYAGADADVTHTAAIEIMKHLDADRFGNNTWLSFWHAQRAAPVACEIMEVGMPFDSERCFEQAKIYQMGVLRVLNSMRKRLNWPTWNPRSHPQVVEALYGNRYSVKRDEGTGECLSVRPMGARTFNLDPVLNNDSKSPKLWSEIRDDGEEILNKPGTNAKTIGMIVKDPDGILVRRWDNLASNWAIQRVPQRKIFKRNKKGDLVPEMIAGIDGIEDIRKLRALTQVQVNFVGVPVKDPKTGKWIYEGGYNSVCCDDGYIRSLISMVKETGRWSASGPNQHALPKKTEAFYEEILKELYRWKIRTMFKAPPGYVLIESDYSSAEMFMLAIASGDKVLWEHCRRGLLPEDHPDFVDIHATVSVTGLGLQCAPTKAGLKSINMSHIRDVTKCVAEGEYLGISNGWIRVEQLAEALTGGQTGQVRPGVFAQSDTGMTPLLAVHNSGRKECFSVKTELGYEVVMSAEHRHYVIREDGQIDFVATKDLKKSDFMILTLELPDSDSTWNMPDKLAVAIKELNEVEREQRLTPDEICTLIGAMSAFAYRRAFSVDRGEFIRLQLLPGVSAKAPQVVALEKLLNRVAEHPGSVEIRRVDNQTVIDVRDVYVTELVRQMTKISEWSCMSSGVPERVLRWPKVRREQFLAGFMAMLTGGAARSPVLVMDTPTARMIQQLALVSGVLLRREFLKTEKDLCTLRPWDQTSRVMWGSVITELRWNTRVISTVPDARVPHVAKFLSSMIGRTEIEESGRYFASRTECLELLRAATKIVHTQRADVRRQVDRIRDFLQYELVADKVASITSVGEKQTYDFETTMERRHLLFYGGVASHNSVVYGWAYGRQAKAIVIGVREQGIIISIEQATAIVDTLTTLYPDAAGFLDDSSLRVQEGFLVTPLGRIRRAPDSTERKKLAGYEREFKNAPIQGGVADVVNIAAYNLREIRRERGMKFKIALQMHDAFYFLVPYDEVETMCNEVIPEGMVTRCPIIPFRLDGSRRTDLEPAYMGCGIAVYFRWGEKPDSDELLACGIDTSRIHRLE